MMISIFLAKIMSIYFFVMGILFLTRRKIVSEALIELINNRAAFFSITLITLILGTLLIVIHPIFILGWPLLITILCWLVFIKGVVNLFIMDKIKIFKAKTILAKKPWIISAAAILYLAIALYLGYYGFYY